MSPVFGSIPNIDVVSSILYVISASKVPAKSASVALISCTKVPIPEFSEMAMKIFNKVILNKRKIISAQIITKPKSV